MSYALTAAALTVVYVLVAILNQPVAVAAGGFYLLAVIVLIAAQRISHRETDG